MDALYVCANKSKICKTIKLNQCVLFDVDKKGYILGIEVLDASKAWVSNISRLRHKVRMSA